MAFIVNICHARTPWIQGCITSDFSVDLFVLFASGCSRGVEAPTFDAKIASKIPLAAPPKLALEKTDFKIAKVLKENIDRVVKRSLGSGDGTPISGPNARDTLGSHPGTSGSTPLTNGG
jgi:hypothetical protein